MRIRFRREHPRPPEELGGVKIPYDKTRRGSHRLAWYLVLGLVMSPILYLGTRALLASFSHTANGTVLLDQQEIRASEAGAVTALKVSAGDMVVAGEPLVVLDSADLDAAVARNAAQLQSLSDSDRSATTRHATIDQELALRERSLQYQRDRRTAIESLVHGGAATVAELDEATAAVTAAESSLLQTERESVALAPDRDVARAERTVLETRRRALTAYAPYGARTLEVLVKPGEYVAAGEPLVVVARLDHPRVVAYVSPKFATQLRVGSPATIYFPDGTRTQASIAETPELTARMPADLVDQFGLRPMTVVLNLLPEERWPDTQRVQGLPVAVRFRYSYETSRLGAWIGRVLGWFAS